MKVTYTLNLPEDTELAEVFHQAQSMSSAVFEFTHNVKRRTSSLTSEQLQGYEKAMEDFYEILHDNKVKI